MAKAKKWTIQVGEIKYHVVFTLNRFSGRHNLQVNGYNIQLKQTRLQPFLGLDQPIKIGEKECRFVLIGNKADIAIDGMYITSKKPYIPLKSMPWWNWVFIVSCVAIPIVSLGGAIPILLALLGAIYCTRISVSPNLNTLIKFLSCLGISILCWSLFELLLFVMSGLL